jgi:hypothetical protein
MNCSVRLDDLRRGPFVCFELSPLTPLARLLDPTTAK